MKPSKALLAADAKAKRKREAAERLEAEQEARAAAKAARLAEKEAQKAAKDQQRQLRKEQKLMEAHARRQAAEDKRLQREELARQKAAAKAQRDLERLQALAQREEELREREEQRLYEQVLRETAPSDLDGATTTARAFLSVMVDAAEDAHDALPTAMQKLSDGLRVEWELAPQALQQLAEVWRVQFAAAWQAARQQSDVAQKKIRFMAALAGETTIARFNAARGVWPSVSQMELGPYLQALQQALLIRYVALNSPPQPGAVHGEPSTLEPAERGVVHYLAGWSVRASLSYSYRHLKPLVPLLQQLVAIDPPFAEPDAAQLYLESRELHGGLLRVRPAVAQAFERIELSLRSVLTKENILLLRESVIAHAASQLKSNKEPTLALIKEMGEAKADDARMAANQLTTRYLHARSKAFRKEVMQAVDAHRKGMAVRTLLKASMIQAHSGGKKSKKAAVVFTSGMLEKTLSAQALHEILRAAVDSDPSQLRCIRKDDIFKLLKSYAPDRPGAKSQSTSDQLMTELVGAIACHDKFVQPDASLVTTPAAPAAPAGPL